MKNTCSRIVTWLQRLGAVRLLPVLTALFALMATNAWATLTAYEPFNYSTLVNGTASTATGTPTQTTPGGFSGNWTCAISPSLPTGLTYTALPVANKAMQSGGNGRQYVSFASSISSGTKYISFLLNLAGNSGGNNNGVYLLNGGTGLWFGQGNFGVSASQGPFYLGTVNTAGSASQTPTQVATPYYAYTFGTTYLVVLKIVYPNSVTAYINPTANQGTPGTPLATQTATISVGTITGIGLQVVGGGTGTLDEIRVGDNYGDVVGFAPPIPDIPTGLGATAGNNSVSLSWSAANNAATYNVKRSTTSGSGYVTVGTSTAPTVALTDSVLGGSTYYYVVSAVNGTGESANSTEVSATPTFAAPLAPTGLNATPGNNTAGLTWTAAAFADSYNVKRSTTSGSGYTTISTSGAVTGAAYTDSTAVNGTIYYYVVSAVNGAGESPDSSQKALTMLPATPTGLSATPGDNSVGLNWTAAAAATGYRVKRSTVSGSGYSTIGTTADPTVAFTDPIIGGVTYYYVVTATNVSGESGISSEVSATPNLVAPAAPTGLAATPGNNTVGLTWTAAAFATSYNVKRSTTSGSGYTTISTSGAVTGAAYTDSTAVNGTVYYYVVSAVNGAGESPDTAQATATMRPATPTGLAAVAGANSVALSWNTASLAVGYRVKRSTTSGSGYSTVGTTANPTVAFTDAIIGGVTYYYVVTATNLSGETVSSSEVSAAPTLAAPSAPTGLAATAGDFNVGLTWTAAPFATSYNVKRSTTSGSGYTTISTTGAVTGTSYTDSTAVNGTLYYYVVSGTNNAGESANSSEVSVTPNFAAVYEPFNYSSLPSGTASTGTGERGNWTCGNTPTIVSGLTYTALPTGNSALSTTGGRYYVNIATPFGSGTKWVSFLFKCAGDPGGNWGGVYLKGDQTTSIYAGFRGSGNGSLNPCGLATVTSAGTATTGGTTQGTAASIANTTVHLIVLRLEFNTSGANDTVTLYIDPTANTASPSVAATATVTTVNVGTISAIGVNFQGGSTITVDEFRIGQTFAAVVGVPIPSAPTALAATPGNAQVSLSWVAPVTGSPTGYNVKRSAVSGSGYTTIGSVGGLAYTDSTAVNGTTYYYVVSGTNAAGEGPNSNEVIATPVAPPGQPQNLAATGGVNSVSLSWDATSGATGYKVLRGTSTGVYDTTNNVASNTNYDSAPGGFTYYYVVQATNPGGVSLSSLEVSAYSTPAAPNPPSGLAGTPSSGQVGLSWSVGTGASGYKVKRSTTSGFETTIGTAPGTSYTDATAINGNIYYYTVSATNTGGESIDSNEAIAAMPPATPTGLSATSGANQVTLSWTASSGASPATSYDVKRSTTSGSGWVIIGTTTAPTVSYTDSTAISGTTYYYMVSGVNASGQGDNSTQVIGTPGGPPKAPTDLTLTTNYTSLTLNWTAAQGAPTGYNVKRATSTGDETTLPTGTNVAGTTFTDTTVATGTEYFYKVSAINGDGEGADSSEVAGAAPGSPSAYEPFNYLSLANGDSTTAAGFTGTWMVTNGAAIAAGLTYPNLYTSNSALQVASGDQYENLSIPLFSGTVYVSFLYHQGGDFGGNRGGLQLLNGSGNGVMFAYHQYGQSIGLPSIDAITSYDTVTGELGASITPQTYATANLYLLRLTYGSGGALASIDVYSNPLPGQSAPAPDFTVSSGLSGVGAITTIGMHTGISTMVDEWRVGTTFSAVVVGRPFATVTLGDLSHTYDGMAKSATASTTPTGLTVNLTYNGSANAPTNAGTYQVIGTVVDTNYYGSATNNLVIGKAAATVTLGSLNQTYSGTARSATATTAPPGLTVNFTYDGSANAPTNVGTYVVVGTVVDINHQGSATGNLVVAPAAYFGTGSGSVTLAGGNATVVMSGVEGLKYSMQRATNVEFTQGISNFPTATAPAGGNVSATDDFGDLGVVPGAAYYRLRYVP